MDDDSVYKYIHISLPYPEIQPMFDLLEEQAQTDQLGRLVQYIRRQWIESEVFTPRNWCVYKKPVRTNKDLEGGHNALNRPRDQRLNIFL